MKVSENFILQEFVGPERWKLYGGSSLWFLDSRLIDIAQALRYEFGMVTINDWWYGGKFKESGLREFDTKTGAKYSQHKYGRAIDCKFANRNVVEVYSEILSNKEYWHGLGVRAIENVEHTPSWLHIDVRNTNIGDIVIVNP